jgi:hypothetical protein
MPAGDLRNKLGQKFAQRRHTRQLFLTRHSGHAQCAQPAGSDVLDGTRQNSEGHVDLAAEQVGDGSRIASIRNVGHVDAGQCLEQFAGHM